MGGELVPDGVGVRRIVVRQAGQARLQRTFARHPAFAADGIVVVQIEGAQQRLERHALG